MSTLRTDFSGSFDSALFAKTETAGTVTQTGGEMIFTGSGGQGICYVTDQTAVDISGGENFIIQMSGTTPAYPARMWLAVMDSVGRGWGFRFGGTGVNLFQVGTFSTGIASWSAATNFGDFDIAVHVFLRARYASGTVYWDYSTDNSSYTNRWSASTPSGMTLTAVKASFGQFESDSADVYKITNYYAPALAGGGTNIGLTRRTGRYPLGGFLNNGFIR